MKLVVNQVYENMGLASTQTLGTILDGLMRNTTEAKRFIDVAGGAGRRARRHQGARRPVRRLLAGAEGRASPIQECDRGAEEDLNTAVIRAPGEAGPRRRDGAERRRLRARREGVARTSGLTAPLTSPPQARRRHRRSVENAEARGVPRRAVRSESASLYSSVAGRVVRRVGDQHRDLHGVIEVASGLDQQRAGRAPARCAPALVGVSPRWTPRAGSCGRFAPR